MPSALSFVMECAQAGRWVRGLIALNTLVKDPSDAELARLALAAKAARHHWQTALRLLSQEWPVNGTTQGHVCDVLAALSQNPSTPRGGLVRTTRSVLDRIEHSRHQDDKDGYAFFQNEVFLAASRWSSTHEAEALYKHLRQPSKASTSQLRELQSIEPQLVDFFGLSKIRPRHDAKSTGNTPRVVNRDVAHDIAHSFGDNPSVSSVARFLALAARLPTCSPHHSGQTHCPVTWQLALSVFSGAQGGEQNELPRCVTAELVAPTIRLIGLRAPHLWAGALRLVERHDSGLLIWLAKLWMVSRASWSQAIAHLNAEMKADAVLPGSTCHFPLWREDPAVRAIVKDILARTTMPRGVVFRLIPPVGLPAYRLAAPTKWELARALAKGYHLHEVQLSQFSKDCLRQKQWEDCLRLYFRMYSLEFQQRAAASLLQQQGKFSGQTVLELLTSQPQLPPLSTYSSTLVIRSAKDNWREALVLFRGCVQRGTRCTPHLLSSVMDSSPPPSEVAVLLRNYPSSVSEGIRRRAKGEFHLTVR